MYAFVAAFFAALVLPVTGLPYEPREAVASPTPCSQNYVCPQPIAYPGVADTGDVPPVDQFKCRIGSSSSDPNFAFCYYNKNTGAFVKSTPSGLEEICWTSGMANPECSNSRRRRGVGVPKRAPPTVPQSIAERVNMVKFVGKQTEEQSRILAPSPTLF